MPAPVTHVSNLSKAIGPIQASNVLVRRLLGWSSPILATSNAGEISIQPQGSDLFVAGQIFGSREYELDAVRHANLNLLARRHRTEGRVPIIVDGGANVGYSALYFQQQYPDAVVLAVEPDKANYDRLVEQCRGRERIVCTHAALWSHGDGVNLLNQSQPSWARSVGEGGDTPSCTLDDLISGIDGAVPLILKLDIEGAERAVIEASSTLVRQFPCIMVEPHDFMLGGSGCLAPLYTAIAGKEVDTLVRGENIFVVASEIARMATPDSGQAQK